jgi:hypothetical protein
MAKEYKPGDAVEHSGVYRVVHDDNHTAEHEVTCVYGKNFRRAIIAEIIHVLSRYTSPSISSTSNWCSENEPIMK